MLKTKQKLVSIFIALAMLIATTVLAVASLFATPTPVIAAETTITFELGENGTASHYDGSSKTTYEETDGDYTLSLTGGTNMYTGARDAKGNSCIKLGTSSKTASFSFTVPDDVTSVIIAVAQYKTNTTKIQVNDTAYTITTASDNGEYTAVEVDTSTTKTVVFETVSGGVRAMVNTITYAIKGSESDCEHANKTETSKTEAECEVEGEIVYSCPDCGETITESIPALEHDYAETSRTNAQCEVDGEILYICNTFDGEKTESISALGHTYVDGVCTTCGVEMPAILTLTFDNTEKRTEFTTSQQVWEENTITFTNNKASSSTNVADYAAPVRLYKSSEIIIKCASMNKIEFVCNTASYATALKNSIANSTANEKVVTIEFDSPQDSFTFTLSGGQVRMDSITVYRADDSNTAECAHNYGSVVTAPTCTEAGYTTYTCSLCGDEYTDNEESALGHNYVDGYCTNENCGLQDPASIDYSGYYYFSFTHNDTVYYVNNTTLDSDKRYKTTIIDLSTETINTAYVFRLVKTAVGIYSIYEFDGDCYSENITVEKVDEIFHFYATVEDSACQFLLNAGSDNKYVKFYKASNATQSNYAQDIILTPVELSVKIDSATITVGESLSMNYYVILPDVYSSATMRFTMGDKVVENISGTYNDEKSAYQFTFVNIPPQCMADNIKAEVIYNGNVIAEKAEYSVAENINNLLNSNPSTKLETLLNSILAYGEAASDYLAENDIVGVENTIPEEDEDGNKINVFHLENAEGVENFGAWFTGANVWFDYDNKICVGLSGTENVTLKVKIGDGAYTEYKPTSNTFLTDGILPTDFDSVYTFELYYGDNLMQTLTYSVNSYAYKMQTNTSIGALAIALYNYGVAAEAYNANNA